MSDIDLRRVSTAEDMELALMVRRAVFVAEQGIDLAIEIDEHDGDPATTRSAVHVLALDGGIPVGTGRLLLGDGPEHDAHIGRVAVLAAYRGQGVGRLVMALLRDLAREFGYGGLVLSAQAHAVGFYEGIGYVRRGEPYLEVGMPHQEMHLRL